jgi:hypothetical protein
MRVAARAWSARQRCRAALLAGDLDEAFRWSATAASLHAAGSTSDEPNIYLSPFLFANNTNLAR